MTIPQLEKAIKNARKNAGRQRARQIAAQGTQKDVRVRPEFWEQVEMDYRRQLTKLKRLLKLEDQ